MPIVNRDMDNEFELLAAAAPELLNALKSIVEKLNERSLDGSKRRNEAEQIARDAIAKAEGK